jgi:signal transduction histidine kinase/CHASE2 domain-containing sensor protein
MDAIIRDAYVASAPAAAVPDVVVVEIGPESVAQVGRWPWPRELHTELIERISAQQPLALGMDMVLSGATPDRPAGHRLAVVMAHNPTIVSPVFAAVLAGRELSGEASVDPMPDSSWQAGMVAAETSPASVLRNSLLASGETDGWWCHLAVGVIDTAVWPGAEGMAGTPHPSPRAASRSPIHGFQPVRLALDDPARRSYKTVLAGDVLAGKIAPGVFKGRVVLVGVAASGVLDARTAMRAGPAQIDSGVQISAGIADMLLRVNPDSQVEPWQNTLFTFSLAMLLLGVLWSQPPGRALKASVAIVGLGMLINYLAWRLVGLWVSPGACLLVALPVLASLVHRLAREPRPVSAFAAAALVMVARLHPSDPATSNSPPFGAPSRALRGPIEPITEDHAIRVPDAGSVDSGELQSLRDFLMAAIESLPDIILVCQGSGQVVIGNQTAAHYFGLEAVALRGQALKQLLSPLTPTVGHVWAGFDGTFDFARYQHGAECRDAHGAEFLLKCAPCMSLPFEGDGWIVSLVDVAALRDAERRRDDAMRFLSHDMRSPLTAILALLTLHREGDAELPQAEMLSRIRRLASRSLALAESFVQLARAEPLEHARESLDLADIVMDAADDCWSQAQAKRITIDVDVPPNAAQSEGDRELVRRAVINLVNNAVKFSPRGSRVVCAVYRVEDDWCVAIRDEGRGIAFEDRELLFKKFVRLGEREPDAEPGAGLGLAFTKTVVDRHGGRIEVDSVLGVGSEFRFYLKASA